MPNNNEQQQQNNYQRPPNDKNAQRPHGTVVPGPNQQPPPQVHEMTQMSAAQILLSDQQND